MYREANTMNNEKNNWWYIIWKTVIYHSSKIATSLNKTENPPFNHVPSSILSLETLHWSFTKQIVDYHPAS